MATRTKSRRRAPNQTAALSAFQRSLTASSLIRIGSNNNIILYDADAMERLGPITKAPPHFSEKVKTITKYVSSGAGTIAAVHDADPVAGSGPVNAWATRYATLFREYRVVAAKVSAESLTPNPGKTMFAIDDQNSTTPTTALMEDIGYVTLSNAVGSDDSHCGGKWTLADTGEASWISTAASRTPFYVKLYTDNAFWLAPAAATTTIVLHIQYTIQFRGRV